MRFASRTGRQASKVQRSDPSSRANARAIAPPAYGIDFVDRIAGDPAAVHAAAARGTRGAGGPLPYLEKIQSSFGKHDIGDVRAHTGAAATAASLAMGASAFASGSKVAFAGTPSLRVAAHEAAHVVQQRAGVHLKGGVGEAGDAYERQADAVAERVVRGESAEALLASAAADPAPGAPAVQRSVGFEIELRNEDWNVWLPPAKGEEENRVPAKGTPVIYGRDFSLQAEYGGEDQAIAELVTDDPGLQTRDQFKASVKDMQRLGGELDAKASGTSYGASEFDGGDPGFLMEKKGNKSIQTAVLQVTVGVPLASVPALFRNLEGVVPNPEEYKQARKRAQKVGGKGAGNEFMGLMVLLHQYLSQLQGGQPTRNYVKGMIRVMARTDFHAMFELMPAEDQAYVVEHMDTWIEAMLAAHDESGEEEESTPFPGGGRLVSPIITDPGSSDPAMRITTTRGEWLQNLPVRDLLSYEGREKVHSEVEIFPARSKKEIEAELLGLGKKNKKPSGKLLQEYQRAQSLDMQERFGTPKKAKKPFWAKSQEKQRKAVESLYMGLGSLGGRMDFVEYQDQPAKEGAKVNAKNYTGAPILEIRNPPNAGPVDNWYKAAKSIYDAVDEAIKYPDGRGSEESPNAPRDYTNVLTPKQLELRDKAKARAKALDKPLLDLEVSFE